MTLKLGPTPLVAILRGVTTDEADSIAAVMSWNVQLRSVAWLVRS